MVAFLLKESVSELKHLHYMFLMHAGQSQFLYCGLKCQTRDSPVLGYPI